MPDASGSVTRRETLPAGQWLRVGSWMFRVVENVIGGHVVEWRPAPNRARARGDRREFDTKPTDGL